MKPILLALSLTLALTGLARAQTSGDVTVQAIWARATPPGATTGAVYLTLQNKGQADDKLIGAETPVADMAMLHVSRVENGVMKMRDLKSIDIGPGRSAELKPGGRHIMLMGLKRPLKLGDRFPVTLTFQHAPPLTVQVQVAGIGATRGTADPDDMKDMGH